MAEEDELIPFGRDGCSNIRVEPFTPICSRPEIDGSSALSLNIPVPTFAPAIPPQECVCFEFNKGEADPKIDVNCDEPGGSFTIEITPSEDCCAGHYTITPHLDLTVPCVPFTPGTTVADGFTPDEGADDITVRNRSGDSDLGIDGGVSMIGLQKGEDDDCCTVRPVIDITLPDCIKYVDEEGIPDTQITYCERDGVSGKVVTKHHKLIEMVQDPEHCNTYPKVLPLEIPCCNRPDWEKTITKDLGSGGKITLVMKRVDCDPDVELNITPVKLPAPQIIPSTFRIGLDGPVVQGGDGNLFVNGALGTAGDEDAVTWYGGGIGNNAYDTDAAMIVCRGPAMRAGEPGIPRLEGIRIPCDLALAQQQLTDADGNNTTPGWCSSRALVDEDGEVVPDENGRAQRATTPPTETDEETGQEVRLGEFGNLDMILPSGFQWHSRGVAVVMSHFLWAPSGLLSQMNETEAAVVLSPGRSVWGDLNTYDDGGTVTQEDPRSGRNASGLDIDLGGEGRPLSGLCVDTGYGLRIFGRPDGRTTAEELDPRYVDVRRIGKLEVYGDNNDFAAEDNQLLLNDRRTAGEQPNSAASGDIFDGEVDPYARADNNGDYTFPVVSAMYADDIWPQGTNNRWAPYEAFDEALDDSLDLQDIAKNANLDLGTARDAAYTAAQSGGADAYVYAIIDAITAAMTAIGETINAVEGIHELFNDVVIFIESLRLMNVHVGRAGVITGVDIDDTGADVARRTDPIASDEDPDDGSDEDGSAEDGQ